MASDSVGNGEEDGEQTLIQVIVKVVNRGRQLKEHNEKVLRTLKIPSAKQL